MFRVTTTKDSHPLETVTGYIVGFSGSMGMIPPQVLVATESGKLHTFAPSELEVTNMDLFDFDHYDEDEEEED